jgi:hypothetical protein
VTGNGVVNGQDSTRSAATARRDAKPDLRVPGNCDVTGSGSCNGQDGNAVKAVSLGLATAPVRPELPERGSVRAHLHQLPVGDPDVSRSQIAILAIAIVHTLGAHRRAAQAVVRTRWSRDRSRVACGARR